MIDPLLLNDEEHRRMKLEQYRVQQEQKPVLQQVHSMLVNVEHLVAHHFAAICKDHN